VASARSIATWPPRKPSICSTAWALSVAVRSSILLRDPDGRERVNTRLPRGAALPGGALADDPIVQETGARRICPNSEAGSVAVRRWVTVSPRRTGTVTATTARPDPASELVRLPGVEIVLRDPDGRERVNTRLPRGAALPGGRPAASR
jgi:hypothetical protein